MKFDRKIENFGFQKFHRKNRKFLCFRFFRWKFRKPKFWKNVFKIFFRRDEKMFLVQIFFYCLDQVFRLPKNCSEHPGKPKHVSARDSVSRLSLKITQNQWTLAGNHALCWDVLLLFILKFQQRPSFFRRLLPIQKIKSRFWVNISTSSLFEHKGLNF